MSSTESEPAEGARFAPDGALAGGGEMGALIRAFDWAQTPIGPADAWSPALRMMVRFLLANRFPLLLWWGPQYVSIYNDPYRPVLGAKHPWALGQPVSECWSEIWHILQPLIDTPFHGGPATWMEDLVLEINRHGFAEETHFTVAYSPVPDESVPSGIGGVLATVHEITDQVVEERRVVALRDLGARAGEAKTAEEACALAAALLANHPKDIPFALLYLIDPDRQWARLAGATGVAPGGPASPPSIALGDDARDGWPWPLLEAIQAENVLVVEDLAGRFGEATPPGPWSDPPRRAAVVPIRSNVAHHLAGLLVVGISARLRFDDAYRRFVELAAGQIATAVANARAYEEERRRAEALAELDRAKTAFFANVSHEFRTPLTLLLGPLEDAIGAERDPAQRLSLETAYRNGLRLLRMVNSLLDFSRIEAGRVRASFAPTDLPKLTTDLASTFRSAVERAGLRLDVETPPLPDGTAVYVDREMWEQIVLNLLSNAFKFTFTGGITVALAPTADRRAVTLSVRDTGTGIPERELPRLFERFHRVQGVRARTHEGTGIGLALVQELVRLHGGTIAVASEEGRGTTFTVTIPTGRAHLPPEQIWSARDPDRAPTAAAAFVEEALRWLPGASSEPAELDGSLSLGADEAPHAPDPALANARVLLADDNADMRDYAARLLRGRFIVEVVGDGEAALAAALERPPDLVLSDVMMPRLDGFGLLRALRADPRTREIPVVLLSARAGEEARVEGLDAGADDYLIKPFSARELLARVGAHLALSRARAEATHREQVARIEAEEAVRARDTFLSIAAHELRTPVTSLKGAAQLLLRRQARGRLDAAQLEQGLHLLDRSADRLAHLTDDLLDIARIRTGQLPLNRQPLELVALVGDAVATARNRVDGDHRLLLAAPDASPPILADTGRIEQVLTNLLDNAIKYSPRGGEVAVTVRADGAGLLTTVRDEGIGLPPGATETIFAPFGRAANAAASSLPGMGLGLYICRNIVERHGGWIRAASDGEGRGTTLALWLPLADAAAVGKDGRG